MLINKAACKNFILDYAQRRAHVFTRVSASCYDDLEAVLRMAMRDLVDRQPSLGKTVKP